jgi:hypothetical protein
MEAVVQTSVPRRGPNWSFITRVGLVVGVVALLVGFALYESFVIIWKGGVINKGDYFEVDLKSMSNFDMDQEKGTILDVPERYRTLDGKKVLLQGEVAPANDGAGSKVDRFQLCYSVAKCCFSGPAKVQHFVDCRSSDGKKMPNYFDAGRVEVYGTLHVRVLNVEGRVQSVFQMDVERIKLVS